MIVYLRDKFAEAIVHAATLKQELQINIFISPSDSILKLSRAVPVLNLQRPAPGSVATGRPGKRSTANAGIEPKSDALDLDAL